MQTCKSGAVSIPKLWGLGERGVVGRGILENSPVDQQIAIARTSPPRASIFADDNDHASSAAGEGSLVIRRCDGSSSSCCALAANNANEGAIVPTIARRFNAANVVTVTRAVSGRCSVTSWAFRRRCRPSASGLDGGPSTLDVIHCRLSIDRRSRDWVLMLLIMLLRNTAG